LSVAQQGREDPHSLRRTQSSSAFPEFRAARSKESAPQSDFTDP
jgi:hypothetical protein